MSNTDDLKAELMGAVENSKQLSRMFHLDDRVRHWEEIDNRLRSSTITEPGQADLNNGLIRTPLLAFLDTVRQHARRDMADEAHRLLRILKPEPTDAELIAALRVELGLEWSVSEYFLSDDSIFVVRGSMQAYVTRVALLQPNGPAEVARALRVLAGQGAE